MQNLKPIWNNQYTTKLRINSIYDLDKKMDECHALDLIVTSDKVSGCYQLTLCTLLVKWCILRGIIRSPGIHCGLSIRLKRDGKVGCVFGAGATTARTKCRMVDWSGPTINSRAGKPIAN